MVSCGSPPPPFHGNEVEVSFLPFCLTRAPPCIENRQEGWTAGANYRRASLFASA